MGGAATRKPVVFHCSVIFVVCWLQTDLKYLCGTFLNCPKSSLRATSDTVASSNHVAASTSLCCRLSLPCSVRWSSRAWARKYTTIWCLTGRPNDRMAGKTDWKSRKRDGCELLRLLRIELKKLRVPLRKENYRKEKHY